MDFLPDEDRMSAPVGEMASLPDSDVLRFIVIKRKIGQHMEPWTIPGSEEFDKVTTMQRRVP